MDGAKYRPKVYVIVDTTTDQAPVLDAVFRSHAHAEKYLSHWPAGSVQVVAWEVLEATLEPEEYFE